MASLYISNQLYIDYDLSGKVHRFDLNGSTLFNDLADVSVEGWEQTLWNEVHERHLDENIDGHGLHAFVYPLIERYAR